jgi:HSF-type DNA-binding
MKQRGRSLSTAQIAPLDHWSISLTMKIVSSTSSLSSSLRSRAAAAAAAAAAASAAAVFVIPNVSSDDDDFEDDDDDPENLEERNSTTECSPRRRSSRCSLSRSCLVRQATPAGAVYSTTTGSATLSECPIARGGVACPFPWKLHDMLEYCCCSSDKDSTKNPDCHNIVTWNEEGTAFGVMDTLRFVQTILPLYVDRGTTVAFHLLYLYALQCLTLSLTHSLVLSLSLFFVSFIQFFFTKQVRLLSTTIEPVRL